MLKELAYGSEPKETLQEAQNKVSTSLDLEAAKLEVANSYGFRTWRQLRTFLDIPDREESDFEHLACLSYAWFDRPKRREKARAMVADDPKLETRSIYSACAAGNVRAVEEFLDQEPQLLNEIGGYFDWEPLLYACYSRLSLPNRSTSDVIQLLLDRGADPNTHYRWGGIYTFSALTGIFGEGEQGPINQPPHPDCAKLARELLNRGADCNDSQALYNRMFQPDNSTLVTLLSYGLTKEHLCNWYASKEGKLIPNPVRTLDYQLQWAVKNNLKSRIDLLLSHGANPEQTLPNDGTLTKIASVNGFNRVATQLKEFGATPYELTTVEKFLNACANADSQTTSELLQSEQDLVARAEAKDPSAINRIAANGNLDGIKLMLTLGFDYQNATSSLPLHHAAHHGHLELVKFLVEYGCRHARRDAFYFSTPLVWALVGNKSDVVEYLSELQLDLFDLISMGDADRAQNCLDSDPAALEQSLQELVEEPLKDHEDAWQTPLAFAALQGSVRMFEMLLDRGANAHVANADGAPLSELCGHEIKQILDKNEQ